MKRNLFINLMIVSIVFLGHSAFDWSWDAPSSQNPSGQLDQSDEARAEAERITLGRQEGLENVDRLGVSNVPDVPKVPKRLEYASHNKLPAVPKVPDFAPNRHEVQNPKPSIPKINTQLQEIIAMNNRLKAQYRNQASELQRIQQQAKIHKQILNELEKARSARVVSVPSDASELIRQEKIKLISQETKRNYDFLSTLQSAEENIE